MKSIIRRIRNHLRIVAKRRRVRRDMPPDWAQAPCQGDDWEDRYAEMRRVVAATMLLG
ncbi:MAG TPA: hypothetical protein VMN56_16160 [Casimicrobiaceae bacterium]|nr:hypothetical protein [Casimicrobiaceae bacterium]